MIWRLLLHCIAGDAVHPICFWRRAVAENKNVAVGAIAGMERETVNQAISHDEKCLRVVRVRVIPQLQNPRRPVRLPALLNDEQPVRSRLGRDEDRLVPFNVRERLFGGVRQRRIR